MALLGKIEGSLEILSAANIFHDVYSNRPHHLSNITPGKIQCCELHEGEWGVVGSIIYWNYTHDGKAYVAKVVIEEIDDVNNSTTFKVIEGCVLESYKNFKSTIKATAKVEGGSCVHWTIEFEKLHADIPDPDYFMELLIHVSQDVEGHLQEQT